MTNLLKSGKPLSRVITISGRDYCMTIKPSMQIEFRLKGKRTRYTASLAAALNLAIIESVSAAYSEKVKEYEHKKKLGYTRLRKIRVPSVQRMFSQEYSIAIAGVKNSQSK